MTVRRTTWDDWYVDGEESAVLVDGNVVVLSSLATALVAAVGDDGAIIEDLAALLVSEFGEPDGGGALGVTSETITTLVDAGILSEDPDG